MIGLEHGNARLAEVGNTLEDRTCRQVATGMQDAAVFVDALYIDAQLLLKNVNLLVDGQGFSRK